MVIEETGKGRISQSVKESRNISLDFHRFLNMIIQNDAETKQLQEVWYIK